MPIGGVIKRSGWGLLLTGPLGINLDLLREHWSWSNWWHCCRHWQQSIDAINGIAEFRRRAAGGSRFVYRPPDKPPPPDKPRPNPIERFECRDKTEHADEPHKSYINSAMN